MSVGRYHEHARNRLNSTVMNVGHYGMARLLNNTLKWGATVQMEKINDKISEWEKGIPQVILCPKPVIT